MFCATLQVVGPDAATVIDPASAAAHPPVLLRDGVLFVSASGSSLLGQAAAGQ